MGRAGRLAFLVAVGAAAVCLCLDLLSSDAFAATGRCDSTGAPTTTVYLPNITKTFGGRAGWVTPIYIQNSGAIQTTVELTFFRFRDGALMGCHKTADLAPGTSFVDNPNEDSDLPDDTQFSVVAKSYGANVVAMVNEVQGSGVSEQGLAYTGFTQGDTTVYLPNVTRRFFGYDVPFIVQDLGTTTATVTARFISFDGRSTFTRTFTVAPGRSGVVDPDYEPAFNGAPNSGLADGTQYAVTLTSTQPIAVVVNAHNEQGAPVAFSHNGIGRGATTLYAPYAAKNAAPGNTFSPVVVQNLGTTLTDAVLTFTPAGVGAAQTFTMRGIPAGGAQAFDPRFTFGTNVPCAVAGPTCLGSGEYSLKITAANPIAAVVLPNSATTAGGYLASTQLTPRTLIPTAFRRVGGPNGWSTRIAAYTGAAAQLTARAFALPSGDIKATFPVTVGDAGWTSFDLNLVPGLADNTQYAVTLDGGITPLTAIALERAGTGGDSFMVFEGFATNALDIAPQPGSVRVSAPRIPMTTTWTQRFTATVRDQFGGALADYPVSWSVTGPIGVVQSNGAFTAGAGPGVGVLTATAGQVTTTVPITVTLPQAATLEGLSFWSFATPLGNVYTETSVGLAATQTIVEQVDADITQVQTTYTRTFAEKPTVYALGSTSTFFQATRTIGGASNTPSWASGLCICRAPHPSWIFIDWQVERGFASHFTIRHELTHVMQYALAGGGFLPPWFDEGNARLEEFTVEGSLWWEAVQRARAASLAALGRLFSLTQLNSGFAWAALSADDAGYAYAQASQVMRLIRSDFGIAGELRVLELLRQGRSFEDAFHFGLGPTVVQFETFLSLRIHAIVDSYPAIMTAGDAPTGPGLTFIVFGLPANAQFNLTISGAGGSTTVNRTADAYGVYYSYLGDQWAPGQYTFSFPWLGGAVIVSATGTKAQ